MSDKTRIEWTDATWNPVWGCTPVSPGCDHCYAETLVNGRLAHLHPGGFGVVRLRPEQLDKPLRWRRPRRIFVNSMSDLFHDDIPDEYIARVFAVMATAWNHTFQVLTKRHGRMRSLLNSPEFWELFDRESCGIPDWAPRWPDHEFIPIGHNYHLKTGPLSNVWLGVSVENQQWANIRIPALLETPAAVRFLSCEPLLGSVSLFANTRIDTGTLVDWVIAGGESGPKARPMHPEWARGLRDECVEHGIPFHFKQRGEWTWNEPGQFGVPPKPFTERVAVMHQAGMTAMTKRNPFDPFERGHPFWTTRITRVGKKAAGRLLDGRTWDEFPEVAS